MLHVNPNGYQRVLGSEERRRAVVMPVAVSTGSRWCDEAGAGYESTDASSEGCGSEYLSEGLPQQVCTRLSALAQAIVTLSTHQAESVRCAICYVDVSTAQCTTRTRYGES